MIQIGISCGFHDSAACLVKDGKIIYAIEEEKFTGIKHDSSFPDNALNWIIKESRYKPEEIHEVCFYESILLKTQRIVITCIGNFQIIDAVKFLVKGLKNNTFINKKIKNLFPNANIKKFNHHDTHIAYSYLTSPFKSAAFLTVDGVGEWETATFGFAKENNWTKIESINYPNSLGMLYSTFTAFLGFKPNEGEYKVMGLAAYGNPKTYIHKFAKIIQPYSNNGSFKLNMEMFRFHKEDTVMFSEKLSEHFGILPRLTEEEITQQHKDLAAALQAVYELYFFRLLKNLHNKTKLDNLVLGGGCAYNALANGKITKRTGFKKIYIPPAPSDAGSAIGACLLSYYVNSSLEKKINNTAFLGPSYSLDEISYELLKWKTKVSWERYLPKELLKKTAEDISNGKIIGWFEGEMEFGARALGHRSIFADPRDPEMKIKINRVIKKRESFRPFAPIVKLEKLTKYFKKWNDVPYMNQTGLVREEYRKKLPAITHIDGTARIQTLTKKQCPRVYELLTELEQKIGFPIVLNTSFNIKDKTMVRSPKDAIEMLLETDLDYVVIENYIVWKK